MRILLLSPCPPYPADSGAEQRSCLLHRALAELGEVDLFIVGPSSRPSFAEARRRYSIVGACEPMRRGERGAWRWVRKIWPRGVDLFATAFGRRAVDYTPDPRVSAAVREVLNRKQYDLIVGRYLRPTAKAGVLNDHPIIVDMDDIDIDLYRTRLEKPGVGIVARMILRSHMKQTEKILDRVLPRLDGLFAAKEEDVVRLNNQHVHVVPNLPFAIADRPGGEFQAARPDSRVVLFVGACGHRVNREGVIRFINESWPKIREAVPDAIFRVVGSGGWESIRDELKTTDGVEIVGFVDELADAYCDCAFTVAPLFEGGGTKIKVLESLYYGRAALVTTHAGRGYGSLESEGSIRVVAAESELAEQAIRMLRSPDECAKMAQEGHEAVLRDFGFARFRRGVRAAVAQATGVDLEAATAPAPEGSPDLDNEEELAR